MDDLRSEILQLKEHILGNSELLKALANERTSQDEFRNEVRRKLGLVKQDPDQTVRQYTVPVRVDPDTTLSPLDKMHAHGRLRNAVNRLNTSLERIDTISGSAKAWHAAANALHQIADLLYDVRPAKFEQLVEKDPKQDH